MPRHRFVNTRERIEEAATRLFVLRGISDTSVRDITREVGISEGALYRHFGVHSRPQLLLHAFRRMGQGSWKELRPEPEQRRALPG